MYVNGRRGYKSREDIEGMDCTNNYKLWVEVLKLAVLDLHEPDLTLREDAYKFIESDEKEFPSFISVCDLLGMDPWKVREKVLTLSVKKDSFQIESMRCCECGKYAKVNHMKKLNDCGMYLCRRCQRALHSELN